MNNIDEDYELNRSRDLMENPQYVNAIHAVWQIETDEGGMQLPDIWDETEWLRGQMLKNPRPTRHLFTEDLFVRIQERNKEKTNNIVRTSLCIMMLFALRLVVASKTKEDNPNDKIIRRIVRLMVDKMKADKDLEADMRDLLQTIDKDGDENEKDGIEIPMGLDILADAPDWTKQLKVLISTYADKAEPILDRKKWDDFDEVWKELAEDSQFAAEMRDSSLGQDFNLLLLFNVFGLMWPAFYKSRTGFQTIAKHVGVNPQSKSGIYSKDYFNPNEIEKLSQGFKNQRLLDHVRGILSKHC